MTKICKNNNQTQSIALDLLRRLYNKCDLDFLHVDHLDIIHKIYNEQKILELLLLNDTLSDTSAYFSAKAKYCRNKNYYDFIYNELYELFSQINVPYAILKGIALAYYSYTDIGLRPSSDIDILVEKKNVSTICDILTKNGFVQGYINREGLLTPYNRQQQIFFLTKTHQTAPFIRKTDNKLFPYICIDVNFDIFWGEYTSNIKIDSIFSNYLSMTYGLSTFYVLSLEANLVQVCLHNYKENNSIFLLSNPSSINLRKYCDIYGLFMHPKLDMNKFESLVESLSAQKYVYYSLYYTCFVFNSMHLLEPLNKWCDKSILNRFGLCENEYGYWKNDFFERLFNFDQNAFFNSLNERNKLKITHNKNYIKGCV